MLPPVGKIMPTPVTLEPVFEDLSGLRLRRLKFIGKVALAIMAIWSIAIAVVILGTAKNADQIGDIQHKAHAFAVKAAGTTRQSDAARLIEVKATQYADPYAHGPAVATAGRPRCVDDEPLAGAALAAPSLMAPFRTYTLLPTYPESAFLPLLRNCRQIDVIMPEWYEIGSADLVISRVEVDAEMQAAVTEIQEERRERVELWPVFSLGRTLTAEDFLRALGNDRLRTTLSTQIVKAAVDAKATAACLRLRDIKPKDTQALQFFVTELAGKAQQKGLGLCLVAALSDQLWSDTKISDLFDKVIVTAHHEPWIGEYPQPLAPLEWFRSQVQLIKANVPQGKLVIGIGGHAVDWVTGRAIPERISLAEAMFRISEANARIDYSSTAKNSYASFFDLQGNRHQIWMMDAASVHNSMLVLNELGIREIAVASLGEEEPALWQILNGLPLNSVPLSGGHSAFAVPEFPDHVAYSGKGAFYRFRAAGRSGLRLWRLDPDSGFVEDLRYAVIPRPVQFERYGSAPPNQIALSFDDGPDAVATAQILDALKRHDAPATFFVVGKAALSAPDLVKRAVDEGHTIGSHSFSHPHMEDISPFRAQTELRANRSLIEGIVGRSPVLYRPPYIRGPGPINEIEATAFATLSDDGYVVAGSDIVPTDWAGNSAQEIVRQVFADLERSGSNVIVLHDGRSSGMHTAEAVDLLIPALRARGYDIVSLPTILGSTNAAMMPSVGLTASVFKGVSVATIGFWIAVLTALFWVCVLASVLRSVLYLVLSHRRDPVFPRTFAGLPSVTVVVPAYNEEKVVVSTVRAILACNYPQLSCIVVDDGSTDNTFGVISRAFGDDPRVQILSQANQGKWQALNNAFQKITSEIAVCVDADTRIAPDAIREIVPPFADSKVAAVAGTVVVANQSGLLTRFQSIEYTTAQQIGRRAQEHLNGILVVPGALGAWRVEAVRDVGLYSNETLTEDADLTIWLRRGGYRIAYAENARSRTEAPADVRSLMKQRLRWSLGNLQTLWKHRKAFVEFGPWKVLSMIDMVFFGYILPILSPVVDLLFVVFLTGLVTDWFSGRALGEIEVSHLAVMGVVLVQIIDIAVAWIAHRRDHQPTARLLYLVPMMNLLYRPLMYVTVYRALWSALSGKLARWNKLRRLGFEPKPNLSAP